MSDIKNNIYIGIKKFRCILCQEEDKYSGITIDVPDKDCITCKKLKIIVGMGKIGFKLSFYGGKDGNKYSNIIKYEFNNIPDNINSSTETIMGPKIGTPDSNFSLIIDLLLDDDTLDILKYIVRSIKNPKLKDSLKGDDIVRFTNNFIDIFVNKIFTIISPSGDKTKKIKAITINPIKFIAYKYINDLLNDDNELMYLAYNGKPLGKKY